MGFLGDLIEQAVESKIGGGSHSSGQASYGGGQPSYSSYGQGQQPPQVYPPWVARWDEREGRWFFVNEQTGQRTWEHPGSQGGYGGGYGGQSYGGEYRGEQQYYQEAPKKDHSMAYGAAGVAAGVVGGALLAHEGHEIRRFLPNLSISLNCFSK